MPSDLRSKCQKDEVQEKDILPLKLYICYINYLSLTDNNDHSVVECVIIILCKIIVNIIPMLLSNVNNYQEHLKAINYKSKILDVDLLLTNTI